ncbi:AraC family transcriptional regulator [Bifidobacterium sp. DSM 109957]|uniref:AraC family transcriptional regulator n=2 Tax=Bifidobacterium oedipodis TaxID=2675322 RepID=A0A7Y0HSH7_9BIFI|nr:AraC family transcriptional regulator [Bifidobacterium sp. DSM 109957]
MEHSLFFGVPDNHASDHIALSYLGISQTEPRHDYGPSMNDPWVIHIVLRGSGTVFTEESYYELKEGDGFLIRPGAAIRYVASDNDPWGYVWFGLEGDLVGRYFKTMGFADDQVAFGVNHTLPFVRLLAQALRYTGGGLADELELNAVALRCLAILSVELRRSGAPTVFPVNPVVRAAVDVIIHQWKPGISVAWVAERINVDRSYLSRVFHRETGLTIKEYIERIRLSRASDLLYMTDMGLGEVAGECGYANVDALTRNFREIRGITPSEYRKSNSGVLNNLGLGIEFLQAAFNIDE